jgi:hypothetical protein
VRYASRSDNLIRLEASHARVSQSRLKTGGCATTGGVRGISRRLYQDQVEDRRVDTTGYVGPYYPYFTIFYILVSRSIIVI